MTIYYLFNLPAWFNVSIFCNKWGKQSDVPLSTLLLYAHWDPWVHIIEYSLVEIYKQCREGAQILTTILTLYKNRSSINTHLTQTQTYSHKENMERKMDKKDKD